MEYISSLSRGIYRKRILLLIVLIIGLFLRIYIAPYSTGSDIPQFAGFADTFLRHGLCFYMYADGSHWVSEKWAYPWPYVYGPIWVFIISFIRLFVKSSIEFGWYGSTYYVYAPMDWIVGVKTVLILFDIISAFLLYMFLRRFKHGLWPFIGFTLYFLNPMTIYISSIYGMFDQVALTFFLASLLFLNKKPFVSGIFLSLTLLTKHTFLYPALVLIIYMLLWRRWRDFTRYLIGLLVPVTVFLTPFFIGCPNSFKVFIETVFLSSKPGYTYPIVYSFNGISSLATYLHEEYGYDMLWAIEYWYIPSAILMMILIIRMVKQRLNPVIVAAIAYIIYTTTYWRVNHQYLVPTIAMAVIITILTNSKVVKITAIVTILTIALWPVAFPTSWWLHAHIKQPNQQLIQIVDKLTLMIFDERFYVIYSLVLTIQQYLLTITYIIIAKQNKKMDRPGFEPGTSAFPATSDLA